MSGTSPKSRYFSCCSCLFVRFRPNHLHCAVNVPLMLFTGTLRVRVLEARGLRPTEWSRRFNQNEKNETAAIDAYVNVDWDEYHVGKTLVRPKTTEPRWNEEFIANDVHSGRAIGFTIFHNCVMPPDDFVANTRIPFDDLKIGSCNDIWVDLEPHGQLHVVIELHGSAVEALFARMLPVVNICLI
ncbi:hypothetical protein RB195_016148 [Necator americanus]|uniref:C2 domain-containing protein n=1 Tax=Necator americanus TaxID=51031 RepID=A0ABR1E7T2_NECAM